MTKVKRTIRSTGPSCNHHDNEAVGMTTKRSPWRPIATTTTVGPDLGDVQAVLVGGQEVDVALRHQPNQSAAHLPRLRHRNSRKPELHLRSGNVRHGVRRRHHQRTDDKTLLVLLPRIPARHRSLEIPPRVIIGPKPAVETVKQRCRGRPLR